MWTELLRRRQGVPKRGDGSMLLSGQDLRLRVLRFWRAGSLLLRRRFSEPVLRTRTRDLWRAVLRRSGLQQGVPQQSVRVQGDPGVRLAARLHRSANRRTDPQRLGMSLRRRGRPRLLQLGHGVLRQPTSLKPRGLGEANDRTVGGRFGPPRYVALVRWVHLPRP